ncbi:glycoside hydrolase family 99-like domain-containing protein [Niabella soli]|uniref:Lipopolysaccharide biosynthesis protein n=1 Tax=Niabella soli DSM 19437 TaxID=929713 RepID=W0F2M0_9BACT|nr:glycoside hydrolase family 99-like domain-containing protein [Niabella soli]AHF15581.1 lipopolysaccharide biosynthesis protein [Niabella soli DSM 19437]
MNEVSTDIKCLAFYLPQFHPIPENDEWWGKGFTEWTNVGKAKPLFKGHQQPVVPADLGYYDLRIPEVREAQAKMAREYGVHGFIYYHYWFGNGRQLLQRPLTEVIESKKPDFPFCVCWANESWSGIWHGSPDKVLIKQEYPEGDIQQHFDYLIKLFEDPRYIRVNDCPLFIIYDGVGLPDPKAYLTSLRNEALKRGLKGLYIVASNINPDGWDSIATGFDGRISFAYNKVKYDLIRKERKRLFYKVLRTMSSSLFGKQYQKVVRIDQREIVDRILFENNKGTVFPMVLPNWDNTPRSGKNGVVITNTTPELFRLQLLKAIDFLKEKQSSEQFLVIKSWNEWAEGNYVEPDAVNGYAYLNVIKDCLGAIK